MPINFSNRLLMFSMAMFATSSTCNTHGSKTACQNLKIIFWLPVYYNSTIHQYTVSPKKETKIFFVITSINPPDSDEIWYIVSWINSPQKHVNVFHLNLSNISALSCETFCRTRATIKLLKKLQNLFHLNCGFQTRHIWIQLITECGEYCKRCSKYSTDLDELKHWQNRVVQVGSCRHCGSV